MKKLALINIYNIVRQSHTHPSKFIEDDYETLKNQIIVAKYYGLPLTIALKYDALMNTKYQNLIHEYLDENDEIGVWWEITKDLCQKAGVIYNEVSDDAYEDGVSRIYSIGYSPTDRTKLIDAYIKDFNKIFGYYPKTIGSWVLDEVTIKHAKENYGVIGAAICRDQLGTDGFSLWGGYTNGVYFPSKNNIYLPANQKENQINIPIFRLLGPDPIYNQEQDLRDKMFGVYTFEPASITGRGKFIDWYFQRTYGEDSLGINYLHIGQENNFLWPNIKTGYIQQIKTLRDLVDQGNVIVQTMKDSSLSYSKLATLSLPASYIATNDWSNNNLKALNYNSNFYRASLLIEDNTLRIRDLFIFRDEYKSSYLLKASKTNIAYFDSLPVLNPQNQIDKFGRRPFIKFIDENNAEIKGDFIFGSISSTEAFAKLEDILDINLSPERIVINGDISILIEDARKMSIYDNEIKMTYSGQNYSFNILGGLKKENNSIIIEPINNKIEFILSDISDSFENEINYNSFCNGKLSKIGENFEDEYLSLLEEDNKYMKGPDTNLNDKQYLIYPINIKTDTKFDSRPTFSQSIDNLFDYTNKGSKDMIDGEWMASTEDMIFHIKFDKTRYIDFIELGFLFNHRQGVIFPKSIKVDIEKSSIPTLELKDYRPKSEIDKENFRIDLGLYASDISIEIKNYDIMPHWAFYKGTIPVFNMIDKIYIVGKK